MIVRFVRDKAILLKRILAMYNTGEKKSRNTFPDASLADPKLQKNTITDVPVAVYRNPSDFKYRRFFSFGLFIFAPIFFISVVGIVIFLTISLNAPETQPGTSSETTTMGDIPLPAGIREITKTPDNTHAQFADNIISTVFVNYKVTPGSGEIYVSRQNIADLNSYYSQKLPKSSWQQANKQKLELSFNSYGYNIAGTKTPGVATPEPQTFTIYYYTRPTRASRTFEVLFIKYETLKNQDQLNRRSGLVGRKAEVGDTLIYLTKLSMTQRT
jgi:hypothetical protein